MSTAREKALFCQTPFPSWTRGLPGAAVRRAVPSGSRSESANSTRLSSTGDASRTEPPHRAPWKDKHVAYLAKKDISVGALSVVNAI